MARILILEDDPVRISAFVEGLAGHDIVIVATANEAKRQVGGAPFDVIFLDNDLGGTQSQGLDSNDENCGYAVAKWIAAVGWHSVNPRIELLRQAHIIVHSLNYPAGAAIVQTLEAAGSTTTRT